MRPLRAAAAIVSLALAAPAAASAATLVADQPKQCYREGERVFLIGQGYTPNGFVDFTRDGRLVNRLQADASGALTADLTLPDLLAGERQLTYVGTDVADSTRSAQVSLLATATDVRIGPREGAPNRPLNIRARGFWGGEFLWAHVRRAGRRPGRPVRSRSVRIGRVEGACRIVRAKRRLFPRGAAPGSYRVQFDTFRRYRPRRSIEYDGLEVTILSPASAR
jgi:hypothetical protein